MKNRAVTFACSMYFSVTAYRLVCVTAIFVTGPEVIAHN